MISYPWLYGEPTIDDMLDDPIVRLVMHHDGLDADDVRAAILPVAERLRRAELPPRLVA